MNFTLVKCFIISIAVIVLSEITNKVLDFRGLLYNSLSEQLTHKQIQNYFDLQDKWQWVGYGIVFILILIKTCLISSTLYIGTFFFSKVELTFKQLWGFVISAEFVFLLVPVFKIIWFYFLISLK